MGAELDNKITSLEQARDIIEGLETRLQQAQWRVRQLEKALYGSSSERAPETQSISKEQILLELFPAPSVPPATEGVLVEEAERKSPKRVRRQPVIGNVETQTERIEPAEKVCPHCGKDKCEIGCERSERFEYIPAKIIRQEIIRPKLACSCGEGGISIAPLPPAVIEGGLPGPGLVAHVVLSKYDDHLPLYRQHQQFLRLGVNFPRQTLVDWVEKAATWLQPVVVEMKNRLLKGSYLQVDETPVRVMDPEVEGRCGKGYLWVAGRPKEDVIFEFHPGRGKDYASMLVGDFKGYLQRDGYGVYGALARENEGIKPVGCWSHVRRKFVEALDDHPKEAGPIVMEIRKLYLLERHAREEGMEPVHRRRLREEKAGPILAALKPRLESLKPCCLPESPLGKAIRYAIGEWNALLRYLEDGELEIDNNLTENSIRPSAIGKKNWLFIGHPEAGWRSAVVYSIIASCRRRGIDPWAYIRDVLKRIPSMKQSELEGLLPANWKPTPA